MSLVSLPNTAGGGTSAINVDEPEQPPESIDVDAIAGPAPQAPEPIDVERAPSSAPVPPPPRRGPHRAARPAPPTQPVIPVPRSPQALPASKYALLFEITQQLRLIDHCFGDEIGSRNRLSYALRRYRQEMTEEREHAASMANMEQVVLGHFASTVPSVSKGSTWERKDSPEKSTE